MSRNESRFEFSENTQVWLTKLIMRCLPDCPIFENYGKKGEKILDNQDCFDKNKRCRLCFDKVMFEVLKGVFNTGNKRKYL